MPHLAREELEMMPVVSASISHAEWVEWHESMVDGSMTQLAFEGHWLIDGLDEESIQVVVGPVPAVPRFILVKLLGGAYRRRRALLWDGTPAAAVPPLHRRRHPDVDLMKWKVDVGGRGRRRRGRHPRPGLGGALGPHPRR